MAAGTTGEYLPDADMDATATITPLTIPPVAGEDFTFEVSVANLGPAPAEGATVHVNLAGVPGSWQIQQRAGQRQLALRRQRPDLLPRGLHARHGSAGRDPGDRGDVHDARLPENLLVDGIAALAANPGLFFIDLLVTADNPDPNLAQQPGQRSRRNAIGDRHAGLVEQERPDGQPGRRRASTFSYELVVQNNGPTTLPENDGPARRHAAQRGQSSSAAARTASINGAPLGGTVICTVPDELAPQDSYDFLINVLRQGRRRPVNRARS